MKDRPILFSAPMVRSLLNGTKTQTRRVVKWRDPAPGLNLSFSGLAATRIEGSNGFVLESRTRASWEFRSSVTPCPYGVPGDQLWVREAFAKVDGQTRPWIETDYRATYEHGCRLADHLGIKKRWTPSIHMPRAASRITLEITGVRVERLQAISDEDCVHEGCGATLAAIGVPTTSTPAETIPRAMFRELWQSINGAESWDANPWVWVVEFQRAEP